MRRGNKKRGKESSDKIKGSAEGRKTFIFLPDRI